MRPKVVAAWLATVAVVAIAFIAAMRFEGFLDHSLGTLQLTPTVDLVFLPSGVRLAAGLAAGAAGALGIFLGSVAVGLSSPTFASVSTATICLVALPGALAPLAARWYGRRFLQVQRDLSGIKVPQVTQLALVYSVLSSSGHQALFALTGAAEASPIEWAGMLLGDFVGAMLCLSLLAATFLGAQRLWVRRKD